MSDTYIVVVLELESDSPGIEATYGPFDYDEAEFVADVIERSGKVRGETVQVSLVQGFTGADQSA
jgi:hypothetical protein